LLDHVTGEVPAFARSGAVLGLVLCVPGEPFAANDVVDFLEACERRGFTRLPGPFDELDHTDT
jgi:hypothetical protein